MASPSRRVKRGKYTGNGSAAARDIPTGFSPQKIHFLSVEGEAHHIQDQVTMKKVGGNAPAAIAAGAVEAGELKFVIASADDTLNKNNVVYYFEAEE
jgi:hypothetical protein